MTFRCRACGAALTRPVAALADGSAVGEEDGEPLVPAGAYCPNAGVFFNRFDGWWAVNLGDAINTRHHHDSRRLQGCCGPDGGDGPNTLCANGHEIGTEKSDCWMPHCLLLDPSAVEMTRERCGGPGWVERRTDGTHP